MGSQSNYISYYIIVPVSTELNNYIKNLQDLIDRGIVEQKEIFLFQDELSLNLNVRNALV